MPLFLPALAPNRGLTRHHAPPWLRCLCKHGNVVSVRFGGQPEGKAGRHAQPWRRMRGLGTEPAPAGISGPTSAGCILPLRLTIISTLPGRVLTPCIPAPTRSGLGPAPLWFCEGNPEESASRLFSPRHLPTCPGRQQLLGRQHRMAIAPAVRSKKFSAKALFFGMTPSASITSHVGPPRWAGNNPIV